MNDQWNVLDLDTGELITEVWGDDWNTAMTRAKESKHTYGREWELVNVTTGERGRPAFEMKEFGL